MIEKWIALRQWWEQTDVLEKGPSETEYFILLSLYPIIYFLSGIFHEIGHISGAILTGVPIIDIQFTSTAFIVIVNSYEKNTVFAKLLGGLFQGAFFSCVSIRYRPLRFVSVSCLIYAVAEALCVPELMEICAFVSEIIGGLVVIKCAW
jgi:hypothetical protein